MKRPDGFDISTAPQPVKPRKAVRMPGPSSPSPAPGDPRSKARPRLFRAQNRQETIDIAARLRAREKRVPEATPPLDRQARRDLRAAARARRRYEKKEVRRFTRQSRRRRVTLLVAAGSAAALTGLVAVAVYSPLLELQTIRIEGTARIDVDDVYAAVDDQLGTPLALVDQNRITSALSDFPLIRSYVTEAVPPDTMVIHIVERSPIGSIASGSGFALVDPAGIVIERSEERLPGVPLIELGEHDTDSTAFDAAVEVLLALPDSLLGQLDTITATTRDDVRLQLAGGGAQILWGSAEDSGVKAQVLAAALAQNFPNVSVYNVSAPGQFSYR